MHKQPDNCDCIPTLSLGISYGTKLWQQKICQFTINLLKFYPPSTFILRFVVQSSQLTNVLLPKFGANCMVHPHWRDVLISPVHLLYCQWLIYIEVFLHNFTLIKEMLPDNCNMSLTSQLCGEFQLAGHLPSPTTVI